MSNNIHEIIGEIKSTDAISRELLDTFDYEYPDRDIELTISTDEFTCVCPHSGLPDFATIIIKYVPDSKCVELKSLKYYWLSYRHVGIFHEHVVNRVLEDFVSVVEPKKVKVTGDFKTRGGVHTLSVVEWNN